MHQVKHKTVKKDSTSKSPRKIDQPRPKNVSSQKAKASKNKKPAKEISSNTKNLFPGWTITKSITSQKNNQFYPHQPYIKDISCDWPTRRTVQLTEQDINFIKANKEKFVYEEIEMLNQYLLTQFLQFLHDHKKQKESAEKISLIFRRWLQRDDLPQCYVFCSAFKVQNPQKFEEYVRIISQHCHYNFKKHTQFETNAYFYKFKLFQNRQTNKSQKKSRNHLNTQGIKQEIKKKREIIQKHLNNYSELYNQHLKQKEQLFKHISNVFLVLKDKGLCPPEINANRQDQNLSDVHKTLAGILKQHQQKYSKELNKVVKPKSQPKKQQSQSIQKKRQSEQNN